MINSSSFWYHTSHILNITKIVVLPAIFFYLNVVGGILRAIIFYQLIEWCIYFSNDYPKDKLSTLLDDKIFKEEKQKIENDHFSYSFSKGFWNQIGYFFPYYLHL